MGQCLLNQFLTGMGHEASRLKKQIKGNKYYTLKKTRQVSRLKIEILNQRDPSTSILASDPAVQVLTIHDISEASSIAWYSPSSGKVQKL